MANMEHVQNFLSELNFFHSNPEESKEECQDKLDFAERALEDFSGLYEKLSPMIDSAQCRLDSGTSRPGDLDLLALKVYFK